MSASEKNLNIKIQFKDNEYTQECKRLMKFGFAPLVNRLPEWLWIRSLRIGDALDIFEQRGHPKWYIGRICEKIECLDVIELLIHYNGWAFRFDERVIITYKTVHFVLNKINKLHSHTAYHIPSHYYLCNRSSAAQIDQCSLCTQMLCKLCVPTCVINGQRQCKRCTVNNEEKMLFETIKGAMHHSSLFTDNVISIITHYAIGYVINCSNMSHGFCDNQICVENQFDLTHNFDNYTYYKVNTKLVNKSNSFQFVEMYGKYYRFSCGVCDIKYCSRPQCTNKDTQYSICLNHPLCSICNNYFGLNNSEINLNKCETCLQFMCNACAFFESRQCKACLISTEFMTLKMALIYAVQNNGYKIYADIVDVIMDYAIGYVINCGNYKECGNEIAFDNGFALAVYDRYYTIDYQYITVSNVLNFVYLHGKYMRFSCRLCAGNHCQSNSVMCSNMDAEQTICFNHQTCYLCQSRQLSTISLMMAHMDGKCSICDLCNRNFCDKCGLKLVGSGTNIQRTVLCHQCMLTPLGNNRLLNNWKIAYASSVGVQQNCPTTNALNPISFQNGRGYAPMLYPPNLYNTI